MPLESDAKAFNVVFDSNNVLKSLYLEKILGNTIQKGCTTSVRSICMGRSSESHNNKSYFKLSYLDAKPTRSPGLKFNIYFLVFFEKVIS